MFAALRKRLIPLAIPVVVLGVLSHEILTTPIYSERELSSMREAAVRLAQQGEVGAGLERLHALSEVAPGNRAVWGDYLTVLVRHGHAGEAIALAKAQPQRALPDYALAELFAAALARGDLASARQFADREIAQSPHRGAVAMARREALAAAAIPAAASIGVPQDVAALPAPPAAAATIAATVAPPASRVPRRPQPFSATSRIRTPVSVSTPSPARVPAAMPEAPSLAEQARAAVQAAEQAPAAARVATAIAALPVLATYRRSLDADATTPPRALRNADLDRVRALTLAGELDAAAALFESIPSDDLPRYGLLNGADLYARRREPERVAALLDRADEQDPDATDTLLPRFYNQLDLEQYTQAEQTLARICATSTSPREVRDARALAAMFAAYDNRLDEAQRLLETLQAEDPTDADLIQRRAQIYRWRGWPRRALATYQQALPEAADAVAVQAGLVGSLADARRFAESNALLDRLEAATPAHPDVIGARAEQRQRELAAYSARVMTGRSSDSEQPVTGAGDIAFEQRLYSAPLADHYRVFAHQRYDWADFPEGSGHANRVAIGGDYRSQPFDVALALSNRSPDAQLGAAVNGEWRPDEHWTLFGDVQSDSTLVPLRALHNGVDGHSFGGGVLYRFDERREARISASRAAFSDDNRRDAIAASYRHGFYASAHHSLAAIAQAYYAENSAGSDVPYYNPDSESSLGGALEYVGILNRRYERSWSHRLVIGAGQYEQQGFGGSPIWDAEYEHRWRASPTFSINGGVLYRSRIYDGDREGYGALFAGVDWRF